MAKLVHYGMMERHLTVPACGDWGEARRWTTERRQVTCPRCRLLVGLSESDADDDGLAESRNVYTA